jgi:hypothetical protein
MFKHISQHFAAFSILLAHFSAFSIKHKPCCCHETGLKPVLFLYSSRLTEKKLVPSLTKNTAFQKESKTLKYLNLIPEVKGQSSYLTKEG